MSSYLYMQQVDDIRDECQCCSRSIPKDQQVPVFAEIYTNRNIPKRYIKFGCQECADMEQAFSEAKDQKRRFTRIAVGHFGDRKSYEGVRCWCGAVAVAGIGFCVPCWRYQRMLNKKEAEHRALHLTLIALKREIKKQKELA